MYIKIYANVSIIIYIVYTCMYIYIYTYLGFSFELGLSPRMADPSYGKFKKDNDDEPADLGNRVQAIRQ